jgi:hypothetical protein
MGGAAIGGATSTGGSANTGGAQSSGGAPSTISCADPLPIEGDPDGPRSELVWLECYENEVNAGAVVTDPQGDFGNVLQRIAMFSSPECDAPIFEVFDDVFNDDPEDFSVLFEREDEPELHAAICMSGVRYWPLEVHFEDEAGHVTSGRVQGFVAGLVPPDDAGGP